MKYIIEKADDLYCVYRWDKIGYRIIAACTTLEDAKELVSRTRGK